MEEKTLIDQAYVKGVQKGHTRAYRFTMGIMIFAVVAAILIEPGIGGFVVAAIFVVIGVLMARYRKKSGGEMQVYFCLRAMTDKIYRYHTSDEGGDTVLYYFVFGDRSFQVNESRYDKAYAGEPYYVMYHAYNNRIVDVFEVAKYDLDPSLDIRP